MKKLIAFFFLLGTLGAHAQVQQSGTVTPGHAARWIAPGVIGDGGTAASGSLTSLGVTLNGSGICQNSALTTAAGYQQICLGATTSGGGYISVQNFGTAIAQGLTFNINGTTIAVPTGGDIFPVINLPVEDSAFICASGAAGLLKQCFSTPGTTVPIASGGTGANTAAAARSALGIGSIATQSANNVAITGGSITGMPSPSANSDVANKQYVDAVATGLHPLTSALYATATVLPNTPTYSNGASGVGATLTAGSNAAIVVDGVSLTANNRAVVKNQAAPAQNGLYTVTTVGDGSTPWVLTRATDFDTAAEMLAGSYILVTAGATNTGTSWLLQTTVATVGSTAVTWVQFATGAVTSVNAQTGALAINTIPGCRLSLETGVPYSSSDQAGKAHVFCVPVESLTVQIYDGSAFATRTFSGQFDITLSGTSSATAYDVYLAYDSATVVACWGPAWTTSTDGAGNRGTGAGTAEITNSVGGRWTNANSMSCKNGGTTYTVAANQGTLMGGFKTGSADQANDTAALRMVWDYWRPINRSLLQGNTASSYVLNSALRQCNATSAGGGVPVKVSHFRGMAGWPVNMRNYAEASSSAGGIDVFQNAIGLNSTSTNSAQIIQDSAINSTYFQFGFYSTSEYQGTPPLGSNTFNCLEAGSSASVTIYGNNGTATKQTGLIGSTWQ